MGGASHARTLVAWINGRRVGAWHSPARGDDEFEYDPAWLASDQYRPLSLSLPAPVGGGRLRGKCVASYFDNLLPDSAPIRRRLQARFGVATPSAIDLLAAVGRDCAGALQLLPEREMPADSARIDGTPLGAAGVERELVCAASLPAASMPIAAGPHRDAECGGLRVSLGGTEQKTALLRHRARWCRPNGATPSTHIFKLPARDGGGDQIDAGSSPDNEWLCLRLLAAFGLPVADAQVRTFGAQTCLVVKRFDRRLDASERFWLRLPQEDLCQATATAAAQRYEVQGGPGIVQLGRLLRQSQCPGDAERFLKIQVLLWMLRAIDGHAKKFSIALRPGGHFELTPSYGVTSAWPTIGSGAHQTASHRIKMAMAWPCQDSAQCHREAERILPGHFIHTARLCGFDDGLAGMLRGLANDTDAAVEAVRLELPADFPQQVSGPVLAGVVSSARTLAAGLAAH